MLLTKRVIGHDGSIQLLHDPNAGFGKSDRGFRKGMAALRDMKMLWTLKECMDMDERFAFKIKRHEECWISQERGVSLDSDSCNDFQAYLRNFNFQRNRFDFLYGKVIEYDQDDTTKDSDNNNNDTYSNRKPWLPSCNWRRPMEWNLLPFLKIKATLGDDGNIALEASQVNRQCMEMVAE